jgi:hypothetical protein
MKNWLIRTKNNHILGPISLNKLKDLLENGSIKSDDEICSGNGYWFYIKEKDLVEKYIYREIQQGFNPISEAKCVLTEEVIEVADEEILINESTTHLDVNLPKNEDLEYPDINDLADVGSDLSMETNNSFTHDDDLELELTTDDVDSDDFNQLADNIDDDFNESEMVDNVVNLNNKISELDKKLDQYEQKLAPKRDNVIIPEPMHAKDKKNKMSAPEIPATLVKKPFFTLNMLIGILTSFLFFLFLAFYFRTSIIDFLRSHNFNPSLIKVANAQDSRLLIEKKKL